MPGLSIAPGAVVTFIDQSGKAHAGKKFELSAAGHLHIKSIMDFYDAQQLEYEDGDGGMVVAVEQSWSVRTFRDNEEVRIHGVAQSRFSLDQFVASARNLLWPPRPKLS